MFVKNWFYEQCGVFDRSYLRMLVVMSKQTIFIGKNFLG